MDTTILLLLILNVGRTGKNVGSFGRSLIWCTNDSSSNILKPYLLHSEGIEVTARAFVFGIITKFERFGALLESIA